MSDLLNRVIADLEALDAGALDLDAFVRWSGGNAKPRGEHPAIPDVH